VKLCYAIKKLGWTHDTIIRDIITMTKMIVLEDEADNIDQDLEKMKIYKVGYQSGKKVSRIDLSADSRKYR
jgi:hypothetical protein